MAKTEIKSMGASKSTVVAYRKDAITNRIDECRAAKTGGMWRIDKSPGLNLRVKPDTGFASYVVRYQVGNGTKREMRTKVVGSCDEISLGDAATEALKYVRQNRLGHDLIAAEREEARAVEDRGLTLRELFTLRLANSGRDASTMDGYRTALEFDAQSLMDKRAREITASDIVTVLEVAEVRSKNTAHKLRSALSGTFRWGMQRRKVDRNPVTGLGFTHKPKPRKVTTTDAETAALWRAICGEDFRPFEEPSCIVLKLSMMLGPRTGEVIGARKSELELDRAVPRWSIPASRMKVDDDNDQIIPLSHQAVELFRRAIDLSGDSEYVFPGKPNGRYRGVKHLHRAPNTITRAMDKARKAAARELDKQNVPHSLIDKTKKKGTKKRGGFVNHDWRKVIATWLGERLERGDIIDRILHHKPRGVTDTFYNFAVLEGPMRDAYQRWADHVWAITGQSAPAASNVVNMATARA